MTTSAGTRRPTHSQWILGLGGWTVFVWGQRIGNVIGADDLSGGGRAWRLAVAVSFTLIGVALVAGVVMRRRADVPWLSRVATGLAVVGSVWWLVRGTQILVGDWDVGFKVVHTVLAVVAVGLSVMVWRTRGYASDPYG